MAKKNYRAVTSTGHLIKDYTGGFEMDVSMWESGLYKFKQMTQELALDMMEKGAKELEEYMKQNAPWRNRTWSARNSLYAEVTTKNDKHGHTLISMELGSPVQYGAALEEGTSHSRAYPIIEPTIRLRAPIVMNKLHGLLNRGSSISGLGWTNVKGKGY